MKYFFTLLLIASCTIATAQQEQPRVGKYKILGASGRVIIPLGFFILKAGNSYSYYNQKMELSGKGTYKYDVGSKSIIWLTGPFKEKSFKGDFVSSFNGAKHSIIMNRGTTAENILE